MCFIMHSQSQGVECSKVSVSDAETFISNPSRFLYVPAVLLIKSRVVFTQQAHLLPCVQCVPHSLSQHVGTGVVLGRVLLDGVYH